MALKILLIVEDEDNASSFIRKAFIEKKFIQDIRNDQDKEGLIILHTNNYKTTQLYLRIHDMEIIEIKGALLDMNFPEDTDYNNPKLLGPKLGEILQSKNIPYIFVTAIEGVKNNHKNIIAIDIKNSVQQTIERIQVTKKESFVWKRAFEKLNLNI